MPRTILEAYVEAIPRIRAQQSLLQIRNHIIGSGNMKPASARAAVRAIEREARAGLKPRPRRAATPEQAAHLLASMGVEYRDQSR